MLKVSWGLVGGMMPNYGSTGGHHISTYQAAVPSADLSEKGPCPWVPLSDIIL
jgi:hypothetical protein